VEKEIYKKFTNVFIELLLIKDIAKRIVDEIETYQDGQKLSKEKMPLISIGPSGIGGEYQKEYYDVHRN